jgi:peptide deformylase
MAVRKILTLDHPVLRAKAKKVSRFDTHIEKLVSDMWETMRSAEGVGLAGPQIGESLRVLVAEYKDEHVALINPEILKRSDEILLGTEGCLSIPGFVGEDVPRSAAVTVKGRDPKGKEIRVKAEGWFARVLQHEIDHLDGILFIDRIPKEQVREVRPDEIADEAEVHTQQVTETVAGPSVPLRRNGIPEATAGARHPAPRRRGAGSEVSSASAGKAGRA